MALNKRKARDIIDALRNGTVPRNGLHEYAVGLQKHIEAMEDQLERIASSRRNLEGRGEVKFVRGEYGAGKTFLSHLFMERAFEKGFVVSNVIISRDTPMHKMDEIYHEVVKNLSTPREKTGALRGLLNRWSHNIEDTIINTEGISEDDPSLARRTDEEIEKRLAIISGESSAFAAVLRAYCRAEIHERHETSQLLLGWLSGEKNVATTTIKREAGIRGKMDKETVFDFLRILAEVSRQAGRAGIVIILDEVETITRIPRSDVREQGLQNIRQIVDAVDEGHLSRCFFVFTGTPTFFDDRRGVKGLPPLDERIRLEDPDDPFPNYRQAQISIQPFDKEKLLEVGEKVRTVYESAYGNLDRSRASDGLLQSLSDKLTAKFGGNVKVVPRQFLRQLIDCFDRIQEYPDYEPLGRIDQDLAQQLSPDNLSDVENEMLVF